MVLLVPMKVLVMLWSFAEIQNWLPVMFSMKRLGAILVCGGLSEVPLTVTVAKHVSLALHVFGWWFVRAAK